MKQYILISILLLSLLNSEQQMVRLGKFLDEWRGDTPQLDDVMVAGYRVR